MAQKILGQVLNPVLATPTLIYTVPAGTEASNLVLTICNTTASPSFFRVFQDDDGSGVAAVNQIQQGVDGGNNDVAAYTTVRIPIGPMSNATGTIHVASETANALTFTLYGIERTL